MSEEEGIRQFESQFGDLDPELESSFRKYITERDEPYYEAVNKRLLPSHLQDCIKEGVCPNKGYTPTPPTPTQQAEMNRDKQEWGAESMISGSTLASVGGALALGAGLSYLGDRIFGDYYINYANKRQQEQILEDKGGFLKEKESEIDFDLYRKTFDDDEGLIYDGDLYQVNKDPTKLYQVNKDPNRQSRQIQSDNENSLVPQQAEPETTNSQQETQSVVPSIFGINPPTPGDPRLTEKIKLDYYKNIQQRVGNKRFLREKFAEDAFNLNIKETLNQYKRIKELENTIPSLFRNK